MLHTIIWTTWKIHESEKGTLYCNDALTGVFDHLGKIQTWNAVRCRIAVNDVLGSIRRMLSTGDQCLLNFVPTVGMHLTVDIAGPLDIAVKSPPGNATICSGYALKSR